MCVKCFVFLLALNRLRTKSGRSSLDRNGSANTKMVMRCNRFLCSCLFFLMSTWWKKSSIIRLGKSVSESDIHLLVFQISYTGVGKTQLNFLRLLSEKATQTFNMTCKGSRGCFDSKSNALEKAIRLQGANDGVLSFMKSDPNVKITQVWTFHHVKESSQKEIFPVYVISNMLGRSPKSLKSTRRSVDRSIPHSAGLSVRPSLSLKSVGQLIGRSVGQSVSHSVSHSVSPPISPSRQIAIQLTRQPARPCLKQIIQLWSIL